MSIDMKGKVVLISGATAGIGEVSAMAIAQMGATVVGIGRNPQKCDATAAKIRQQTGNNAVEFLVADLSLMSQVRKVAEEFSGKYSRLDVLVNNAGAYFQQRQETAEGIEKTFALNHLNYFLMTTLLLDRLKASAPARVVNVSSGAHVAGKINFDDLNFRQRYNGWRTYAQSKLANILFTYELARRTEGMNITANTLHPGFVSSNFAVDNFQGIGGVMLKPLFNIIRSIAGISVEEGAKTQIYLATTPDVANVSGKYFEKSKETRSSPLSYDREVARRLWEVSEEMVS